MSAAADILIVGGGLGGLSAAVRLAHAGKKVVLLEKNDHLGGKCDRVSWEGYHFDTGPSLLSMPFVLQEVFADCGRDWRDYLSLRRVETPACKYFFPDGSEFCIPDSMEKLRSEIARVFPHELDGFDRFIRYAASLYEVSGPLFLFAPFSLKNIFKTPFSTLLKGMGALRPRTMNQVIESYFRDPRLVQLLRRYATYNGSDPWRTPQTFCVIPYVEWQFGAWHVEGGMYAMVKALEQLAKEVGVDIRLGQGVTKIVADQDRCIQGVDTKDNGLLAARMVVCNQDAISAHVHLLQGIPALQQKKQSLIKKETSVSGFVLLAAVKKTCSSLAYHNVFFCENYDQEFRQIFQKACPLVDPTIYISIPSKMDSSLAPAEGDAWFVLVNAPPLDRFSPWEGEAYEEKILHQLLCKIPALSKSDILWTRHHTPQFFAEQYGAWQGSLYGQSSNRLVDAFFRVPNESKVKGLFFCGGSAHPGGGIPLVLSSGKMAAQAVLKRLS